MMSEKIHSIEHRLSEFTTPLAMFRADAPRLKEYKTLLERMAHYHVPGVSIAVINDYELK
jgi:hypothetical protein